MTVLTCLQQPPYNNIHLSTILPETSTYCMTVHTCPEHPTYNIIRLSTYYQRHVQLCLSAYCNHLTITSICPPYYQGYQHPPVYHTTRDTTILTCLQQPPYNNIHLFTILPETRLYLPAYSNHFTITTSSLPYYQTQP